jgi:hypothetical protein
VRNELWVRRGRLPRMLRMGTVAILQLPIHVNIKREASSRRGCQALESDASSGQSPPKTTAGNAKRDLNTRHPFEFLTQHRAEKPDEILFNLLLKFVYGDTPEPG